MTCYCGCAEFGDLYRKNLDGDRVLDTLYCKNCGQVYKWTGSYLSLEHGKRIFC